jgi:hypothetical protein
LSSGAGSDGNGRDTWRSTLLPHGQEVEEKEGEQGPTIPFRACRKVLLLGPC